MMYYDDAQITRREKFKFWALAIGCTIVLPGIGFALGLFFAWLFGV
jgi:hypothetical protein